MKYYSHYKAMKENMLCIERKKQHFMYMITAIMQKCTYIRTKIISKNKNHYRKYWYYM
jgi:hypothetical protein